MEYFQNVEKLFQSAREDKMRKLGNVGFMRWEDFFCKRVVRYFSFISLSLLLPLILISCVPYYPSSQPQQSQAADVKRMDEKELGWIEEKLHKKGFPEKIVDGYYSSEGVAVVKGINQFTGIPVSFMVEIQPDGNIKAFRTGGSLF